MMARFHDRLEARVLFWTPRAAPPDWNATDLWTSAERIPGVAVLRDEEGREASRFGAATSGGVALYDSQGGMLFEGGITSFVRYLNRNRQTLHPVVHVEREVETVGIEVAVQYTDADALTVGTVNTVGLSASDVVL